MTLFLKKCKKCNTNKPAEEFSKGRNVDGLHSYCKDCMKVYASNWWEKTDRTNYHYLSKYNLTTEDVHSLIKSQDNKCALCNTEVKLQKGFSNSAHVDHCHTTGTVRGILCGNCNTALGKLGDSVESIQRVLDYLKKSMI